MTKFLPDISSTRHFPRQPVFHNLVYRFFMFYPLTSFFRLLSLIGLSKVPVCPQCAPSVPQRAPACPSVPQACPKRVPACPSVPQRAPACPSVSQRAPACPSVPQCAPAFPSVSQCVPVCPSVSHPKGLYLLVK